MSITSERILEAKNKTGLSYGGLSKITNIQRSTLHRYATGNITNIPIESIEQIAKAANLNPAYLIGWTDDSRIGGVQTMSKFSPPNLNITLNGGKEALDLLNQIYAKQKEVEALQEKLAATPITFAVENSYEQEE